EACEHRVEQGHTGEERHCDHDLHDGRKVFRMSHFVEQPGADLGGYQDDVALDPHANVDQDAGEHHPADAVLTLEDEDEQRDNEHQHHHTPEEQCVIAAELVLHHVHLFGHVPVAGGQVFGDDHIN